MLVVDLHCGQGHHFEGWFASADDLASQQARGLVNCPVCGALDVQRRPSAPHLNVSGAKAEPIGPNAAVVTQQGGAGSSPTVSSGVKPGVESHPVPSTGTEAMEALQAMYLHVVRKVVENTEDVGRHFAEEVRRMHHGEEPVRAIRGQATPQEKASLQEEGIDVLSLPVPEGFDGPLQ
jgi:hypothetical protein